MRTDLDSLLVFECQQGEHEILNPSQWLQPGPPTWAEYPIWFVGIPPGWPFFNGENMWKRWSTIKHQFLGCPVFRQTHMNYWVDLGWVVQYVCVFAIWISYSVRKNTCKVSMCILDQRVSQKWGIPKALVSQFPKIHSNTIHLVPKALYSAFSLWQYSLAKEDPLFKDHCPINYSYGPKYQL